MTLEPDCEPVENVQKIGEYISGNVQPCKQGAHSGHTPSCGQASTDPHTAVTAPELHA